VILGTLLLVLVIGAGIAAAWKLRATVVGDDRDDAGPPSDELLVALAREHDRRRS
jgi:hypothetical protein